METTTRSLARTLLRQGPLRFSSISGSTSLSRCTTSRIARPFSCSTLFRAADDSPTQSPPAAATSTPTAAGGKSTASFMNDLANILPSARNATAAAGASPPSLASTLASTLGSTSTSASTSGPLYGNAAGLDDFDRMRREVDQSSTEEYKMAIFSHKHNTHVTVCNPTGGVVLSVSCGNLGIRKSNRGSYDAAYQLGAYVCTQLYQRNMHRTIQKLAVSLRGFGQGREAVSKVLLGTEGRMLRNKITKVVDTTRLKFGGTRSPRKRRLG